MFIDPREVPLNLIKRLAAAVCAATVLIAGSFAVASPAAAADGTKCTGVQSKSFNLPNKSDITVYVYLCFISQSGRAYAQARATWRYNSVPLGSIHKFDRFDIDLRLEHRDTEGGGDTVLTRTTCTHWLGWVNDATWPESYDLACDVSRSYYTAGYWSTDATIIYDIDNDGGGSADWDVTGTPLW